MQDETESVETNDESTSEARPMETPRSWGQLLGWLAAYKIVYYILIFVAIAVLPPGTFSEANFMANFHRTPTVPDTLVKYFETWDAQWYLYMSFAGYEEGAPTAAFFPLWPLLIRLGSYLTGGSYLISALILANLFSVLGLAWLHRYLAHRSGNRLADRSLLLLLAFPGALFFAFPYTESLFLIVCVATFVFLSGEKFARAGWAAFLAAASRPTGVLLALPMAAHAWYRRKPVAVASIVFPVAGFLVYLALVQAFTGNAFAGFSSQQEFIAMPSAIKVLNVPEFLKNVFQPLELFGFMNSAFDRLWLLWFLLALWPIYKEDRTWFWYALAMGLVPAMSTSMMSYTRYVLMVFPMFVVTARFLDRGKLRFVFPLILVALFAIQAVAVTRHINNHWVA